MEQAVAAPLCTARLADAGARVIKVERADGDFARYYDSAARGDSSYFAWTNHGKESIVLDIKNALDAELLHRMIAAADVFVQNLAPRAMARAGFDPASLRASHPRLITCDISGYGAAPELADKKAYDLLVQAESGLVGISGGANELGRIGVSICDIGAGITAYSAILEAIIGRSASGHGAGLHVSLFDVAAEWMTVPLVQEEFGGGGPERVGLRHPSIAPYGAYFTAEGELTLISIQNEREWHRLCGEVLGRPDLGTDDRFSSNTERVKHRGALETELTTVIGAMTQATFTERLRSASIAFGAVTSLADLGSHPALRRRVVVTSDGEVSLPAHPSRSVASAARRVPRLGEHSDELRSEFAAKA